MEGKKEKKHKNEDRPGQGIYLERTETMVEMEYGGMDQRATPPLLEGISQLLLVVMLLKFVVNLKGDLL